MKHLIKIITIIIIEIILICNFNITTYATNETTKSTSNVNENNKTFSDGIYKITVGKDSNKAIEVPGGWKDDNSPIGIWDYRKCSTSKIIFGISK